MPSGRSADLQLPDTVPGTAEDLVAITLVVIGAGPRGPRPDDNPRMSSISGQLHHLAATLLTDLKQQMSAPTPKELEAKLTRITRLSEELTEELYSLFPFSLDLLNTIYHASRGWDETAKVFVKLGLGTAPIQLAASAINNAAKQQVNSWRKGTILGRVQPTRPGPQRSFQRIVGDPRVFVADQVAQIIVKEQGIGAITSEETGPLYEAVGLLWNYATGLSDQGANLRHYVRRGARSQIIQAQLQSIRKKIEEHQREFYTKPEKYMSQHIKEDFRHHIAMLEAEAHNLSVQAHAALWDYDRNVGLDSPSE